MAATGIAPEQGGTLDSLFWQTQVGAISLGGLTKTEID